MMAERRLVRVFVWKQGSEPTREYVRQVLRVAAPDAVPADDAAPLLVPVVERGVSEWPADFWSHALPQMRQPIDWTDRARYDIAGWQGSDSRSAEKLFVVSVYSRPQAEQALSPAVPAAPLPYTQPTSAAPVYTQPAAPPPASSFSGPPYSAPSGGVGYGAPSGGFPVPGATGAAPSTSGYGVPNYSPPLSPPAATNALPDYLYPGRTGISPGELGGQAASYAGFGHRLAAALLDFVIIGLVETVPLIAGVLSGRSASDTGQGGLLACLFSCFGLLIAAAYFGGFWALFGQTPGMMLSGIKVVDTAGNKPDFGRAMLRLLGYAMSFGTLGFGFLMIASDERKQGLHDRVASTFVVPTHQPQAPTTLPTQVPAQQPMQPTGYLPPAPAATMALPIYSPPPASPQPIPAAPDEAAAPADLIARSSYAERGEKSPADQAVESAQPLLDDAPTLFRRGLQLLAEGERAAMGAGLLAVEPEAARAAFDAFAAASRQNPGSAVYHYFSGVAQRYGAGFETARAEFGQALQLDPTYWEARMQQYFGAAWHDAFAYSQWLPQSRELAGPLAASRPQVPGARLVLVREGGGKTAALLLHTRRANWRQLPTDAMPARIQLLPVYSPYGMAVALYVAVRDNPQDPYRVETFLNPAETPMPGADATMLGQNLILQLARQSHTYLIFSDENGALLHNRRLMFDPPTQYALAQLATAVQQVAAQAASTGQWLPLPAFQQAAQWHTERFPLQQIQV